MDKNSVNVLECFYSIDGETKRSGELVWFIRLSGCNLHCAWCDTDWCHFDKGTQTDIDTLILSITKVNKCRKVTITGGEPLIHPNITTLVYKLLDKGFDVNIETNGSISPAKIFAARKFKPYRNNGHLWFSLDYKCTSSKMKGEMISGKEARNSLTQNDCYKFVVANGRDLDDALARIKLVERYYNETHTDNTKRCTYYISPCFGEIELPAIIEYMKNYNMIDRIKFQIQIHKIIWNPNKRGV